MFPKRRANGKVAYYATFVYQGRQIQELVATTSAKPNVSRSSESARCARGGTFPDNARAR
jgi:hypothetical protein